MYREYINPQLTHIKYVLHGDVRKGLVLHLVKAQGNSVNISDPFFNALYNFVALLLCIINSAAALSLALSLKAGSFILELGLSH